LTRLSDNFTVEHRAGLKIEQMKYENSPSQV